MPFKTHASHVGRGRPVPKLAWVQVPLPQPPASGVRKVRLLSPMKGFCVAQAIVSVSRQSPPATAETRDLEKARSDARSGVRTDPSLVGYWKFSEASGTVAADSSPYGID